MGQNARAGDRKLSLAKVTWVVLLLVLAGSGRTETLKILAPDLPSSVEPGGAGRDAEIVTAIMRSCGITPDYEVLPFGRHIRNFVDTDRGDAVMTVPRGQSLGGFPSRTYIWYQNGAILLESNPRKPYRIEHLRGMRVVTFAGGNKILNLEGISGSFSEYMEHANQRLHASMLYMGRVDVVLADGLIFAEAVRELKGDPKFAKRIDTDLPVMFVPIFNPSPFTMVFREETYRDRFNDCLRHLEASGELRVINKNYIEKYRQIIGRGYLGY